jgi:hypothetical protein
VGACACPTLSLSIFFCRCPCVCLLEAVHSQGRSLSRQLVQRLKCDARGLVQARSRHHSLVHPPLARIAASPQAAATRSFRSRSLVPQPPLARSCSRSLVQPLARAAARSCSRSLARSCSRRHARTLARSDACLLRRLLARMFSLGCARSDALARMFSLGCSRSDALPPLSSLLLSLYISVCIDCVKRVNVNGALSLLRYSYAQQPGRSWLVIAI